MQQDLEEILRHRREQLDELSNSLPAFGPHQKILESIYSMDPRFVRPTVRAHLTVQSTDSMGKQSVMQQLDPHVQFGNLPRRSVTDSGSQNLQLCLNGGRNEVAIGVPGIGGNGDPPPNPERAATTELFLVAQ